MTFKTGGYGGIILVTRNLKLLMYIKNTVYLHPISMKKSRFDTPALRITFVKISVSHKIIVYQNMTIEISNFKSRQF